MLQKHRIRTKPSSCFTSNHFNSHLSHKRSQKACHNFLRDLKKTQRGAALTAGCYCKSHEGSSDISFSLNISLLIDRWGESSLGNISSSFMTYYTNSVLCLKWGSQYETFLSGIRAFYLLKSLLQRGTLHFMGIYFNLLHMLCPHKTYISLLSKVHCSRINCQWYIRKLKAASPQSAAHSSNNNFSLLLYSLIDTSWLKIRPLFPKKLSRTSQKLTFLNTATKYSRIRPFVKIRTKSYPGLFRAETRPPSKFRGNWFNSFCVIQLTNQPIDKDSDRHR